jgi:hypothetical protein
MVGTRKECSPMMTPAFTQQHTLSSRRCAHRRRVDGSGECEGIFAVRRCLLNGSTGGDVRAGLLPATQGERRRRRQPIGQDREGLMARSTNPASHPNAFVAVIVCLAKPLSMTNDRLFTANRTPPREEA